MTFVRNGGRGHRDALHHPHPAKGPGTLFLEATHEFAFAALRRSLCCRAVEHEILAPNRRLALHLDATKIAALFTAIDLHLSDRHLQTIKAVFINEPADRHEPDFRHAHCLAHFIQDVQAHSFDSFIDDGHLTTLFQPIVDAQHPACVTAHECLIRGVDNAGNLIAPDVLFGSAHDAALLFHLDAAARLSNIQVAALHAVSTDLFMNLTTSAIAEPRRDLQTTMLAIENAGINAEHVIFDIADWKSAGPGFAQQLSTFLHERGFRTSLDDLTLDAGWNDLTGKGRPDFFRLDRPLLHDIDHNPQHAEIAQIIIKRAHESGARTIAVGIESRSEMRWAQQNGVDLLQGFYIGHPVETPNIRPMGLAA